MKRFVRAIDNFSIVSGKILSISLVIITLILVFEVVMRYVFNAPTTWVHLVTGMTYAVCFFWGGAYALYYKAHVNVDILYGHLSTRKKAIFDIITAPFLFLVCFVLIYYGSILAIRSIALLEVSWASTWRPPIYPFKVLVVIAAVCLLLQVIANFIRNIYIVMGRSDEIT